MLTNCPRTPIPIVDGQSHFPVLLLRLTRTLMKETRVLIPTKECLLWDIGLPGSLPPARPSNPPVAIGQCGGGFFFSSHIGHPRFLNVHSKRCRNDMEIPLFLDPGALCLRNSPLIPCKPPQERPTSLASRREAAWNKLQRPTNILDMGHGHGIGLVTSDVFSAELTEFLAS